MSRILRAVPDTPPRAILYLRQSTYREESISLVLQETAARDYCERMGYVVTAVEADPGISGRTWKRPAVQRVMNEIENGHADIIVLWRWSRLSRSRKDWALAADRVDVAGGRIESATEPNDNTAAGRFGRGVMVELSAFESERIGEQWREVHANRIARGLPSGRLPWGWTHTDGGIAPHPDQAPAIPHLYNMYLSGSGGRELAAWLESRGYLTYYGKSTWNHSTVTTILDSPIHSGQITHHGELHPGGHEPLVSIDTWTRYRALRQIRANERAARHAYLLSGLITCGTCEQPMYGIANNHSKRGTYHAYRCKTVQSTRGHGPASVSVHLIEPAFMRWLTEYSELDEPEPVSDAADTPRLEAERLAREIASIDTEVVNLTIQFGASKIPERAYLATVAHHESRRATLATTLGQIEAQLTIEPSDPIETARSLLATWGIAPVAGRRETIRELVSSMTVHHGDSRRIVIGPRRGRPVTIAL